MKTEAISLRELEKLNSPRFRQKGFNSIIHAVDYEKSLGDVRYLFLVQGLESYSSASGHIVSLVFDRGSAPNNKSRPLVDDVKLHCQCPSFVYWGPAYNSTQDSYNLGFNERRPPSIRDPNSEIKICKHIARVIVSIRTFTYDRLDDKVNRVVRAMVEKDFGTVPIEQTFSSLASYLEKFNKDVDPREFISTLTRENYEESLLRIGAIR